MTDTKPDAPKRRIFTLKRVLLGIAAIVLLIILLIPISVWFIVPPIVKGQVASQGSAFLGVPVRVENVSISLWNSAVTLRGITVANPDGFTDPHLLSIDEVHAGISLSSLMTNTISLPAVRILQPEIALEATADGRQNLRVVLNHLEEKLERLAEEEEARTGRPSGEREEPEAGPTPGFFLRQFDLEGLRIAITDAFGDDEPVQTSISLGALRLSDVFIPPSTLSNVNQVATLTLEELSLMAAEKFPNREFLAVDRIEVRFDLARIMGTLNEVMEIHLPLIQKDGLRFVSETLIPDFEEVGPQNIREFNYALMNAAVHEEPRRFRDLDREASEQEPPPPPTQDIILASVQETIENVVSIIKPEKRKKVEKEEAPLPNIALDHLALNNIRLEMHRHHDPAPPMIIHEANVRAESITFPHRPGRVASLNANARVFDAESLVTVNATGDLTSEAPDREMKLNLSIQNQALAGIWKLNDGRLNGGGVVNLANKRAAGRVEFKITNFSIASPTPAERAIQQSIRMLGRDGVPPVQVPFDVAMGTGKIDDLAKDIFFSILSGLGANLDVALRAVAAQVPVEQITEQLGAAGALLQGGLEGSGSAAGDALQGGVREIDGAARDAIGRVGGLLGRRSRDQAPQAPEDEATPTE